MESNNPKFRNLLKLKKPVLLKSFIVLTAFLFFIFLFVFSPSVLAEFEVGNPNYSISRDYGPNFSISGWINMSFNSEPADSVFNASFDGEHGKSINLEELLESNPGYDYSCTPVDCDKDYSATGSGEPGKNFSLDSGESKIIGLKLTGNIYSIENISFDIISDAQSSCNNQLEIDFFNDGEVDFRNDKASTGTCSKYDGCFDESKTDFNEFYVGSTPYCQKINISESPGYKIGALIKKDSGASRTITMALYDEEEDNVGECNLDDGEISTNWAEVSCEVNYASPEKEHYVCIYSPEEGSGDYKIKGYNDPLNGCGFYGYPVPPETPGAYSLFAEGKKFAIFGTLQIRNSLPTSESLSILAENYISEKYGSLDCTEGCIIPIKITSRQDHQSVTFSNPKIRFNTGTGETSNDKFYDVTESPAKITSENFQKLRLDNTEFRVPEETGTYDFVLKFNGEEIISKEIEVKNVPIIRSIEPTLTTTGFPTTFEAKVTAPENVSISSYTWEFSDSLGNVTRTETTTINKVIHIYNKIGTYNLKVSATDTKGLSSSKTFEINVTSPKELISSTLEKMDKKIEKINSFTSSLPLFQKTAINSVIKPENISSQLEKLKQEYNAAITPEENLTKLNEIVGEILEMKVPDTIFKSVQADSSIFFPSLKFVDMDAIQAVAGGNYTGENEENYKKAVSAWQQKNLDVTFDFNKFSADYDTGAESLVSTFEFVIEEKSDLNYDYFIFIPALEEIGFDKKMQQEDNFYYAPLGESGVSRISFYTTEDIGFVEIPVFISPSASRLPVAGGSFIPEEKPRTLILILILVLLVIFGIVAYIILFQWYKKKYEGYLFPNRNDLYNVVHYVNQSKRKGLKNKEIIRNLKKAGWNSEQIRYVMRKYEGKRTGMVEIPITKLIRKIEKEKIKKREQGENPHTSRSYPGNPGPYKR